MGMPVITPGTITREDAVGDIITSVAMEESAIAHILNAESEKLMTVVQNSSATTDDLMAINKSVKNSIYALTRLEMQLASKLDMFKATICQ